MSVSTPQIPAPSVSNNPHGASLAVVEKAAPQPAPAAPVLTQASAAIDRKSLLAALRIICKVARRATSKAAEWETLVRLSLSGGEGCTLAATDCDSSVAIHVAGADVTQPGAFLLPAHELLTIARESGDDHLILAADGSPDGAGCEVRTSRGCVKFGKPATTLDQFHGRLLVSKDWRGAVELAASGFAAAIDHTAAATDTESSRYALGGLALEAVDGVLEVVGTDGRRLHHFALAAETADAWPATDCTILPTKPAKLLAGVLRKRDESASVSQQRDRLTVSVEGFTLVSRLMEGRYPNWRDIMPQRTDCVRVEMTAGELLAAVKTVAAATTDECRGADIAIDCGGAVRLSHSTGPIDNRRELASAQLIGTHRHAVGDVDIMLDPRFMADILKPIGKAERVTLEVADADSAVLFTRGDFSAVLMPLARDRS